MLAVTKPAIRCAIYTRKSSDEGLEQEFNSLDAQREACEAFIKSQRHEGWIALKTRYDDGGYSGGTMNRPALQQLLSDIAAGQVDLIIVYKVDRLTRSLMDFSKIVESLEKKGVNFVSVTQQFSTTTSMGRLTLNMLLSFAQFEREVTGERIRDKIAASKQKGMWMGGRVPLGYDANGRTLKINDAEAAIVRRLYNLYLELGSVRLLKEAVDRADLRTKARTTSTGQTIGGCPFGRGNLYELLSNPLYVGEIRHKGKSYPGQHPPIIERDVWDAVQVQLTANRRDRCNRAAASEPSLLAGLIFDTDGERLTPTHAGKNGRRYRYYCSAKLVRGVGDGLAGGRIPAHEVETLVTGAVVRLLTDNGRLIGMLGHVERAAVYLSAAKDLARRILSDPGALPEIVRTILNQVVVRSKTVEVVLSTEGVARSVGLGAGEIEQGTFSISLSTKLTRSGFGTKFILGNDQASAHRAKPEPTLIKAIVRASDCFDRLSSGRADSITAVADHEGISASFLARAMRLAFLAPDIVQKILDGEQPRDLSIDRLVQHSADLPIAWSEQRTMLGFA